jgi:PTH1 family peptidyl-tRNA hydrolase
MFNPRFLVVSLGNPAPYQDTLHSAGHVALSAAQKLLHGTQPAFASQRLGKKATQASAGPKYIFLQSPTLMNITGPWLVKAYKEVLAQEGLQPNDMGLVLVHDELEIDLGGVKVRSWERSHKGHNGVKSINASLRRIGDAPWARVSVGIGRPAERDAKTVSDYVLRTLSRHQKEVLGQSAVAVLSALEGLEEEWRRKVAR